MIKILFFILLWLSSFAHGATGEHCKNVSKHACQIHSQIGRGINLGNVFDPPYEGAWGEWFDERFIEEISKNFDSVRIPIRWTSYASEDASAMIEPDFLEKIDNIVKTFLDNGLTVVISLQHYKQIYGSKLDRGEKTVDEKDVLPRFFNIWHQLSIYFKNHSRKLLFEPLNEPHGRLGNKEWQYLISEVTAKIRENDVNRILVLGPIKWNSVNNLNELKLPKNDKNILATVHTYEPFKFTHQNISYLYTKKYKNIACCNIYQTNKIERQLKLVKEWSKENGIPVFVGEFGSVKNADRTSRIHYLKTNIALLNKFEIPWFYWNFASDFGFYNSKTSKWDMDALKQLNPNQIEHE